MPIAVTDSTRYLDIDRGDTVDRVPKNKFTVSSYKDFVLLYWDGRIQVRADYTEFTAPAGASAIIVADAIALFLDTGDGTIGGSGTLNYVAKFTPDGLTIGNSQIFDNGTNVGFGTASPSEQLHITGNFRLPPSTATTGIIYSGANRYIHNYGTNNFFAGVNAGNFTMTGDSNIAVGVDALTANTTGLYNTAIGFQSLISNTTGNNNTASGYYALRSNISGYSNTAHGMQALYFNNTGYNNTANGMNALANNTTGNDNTANGYQALYNNTGNFNVAIGANAGFNQTAASNLLFIDNQDRTTAAAELTNALIYGVFHATPASQVLTVNAVLISTYKQYTPQTTLTDGATISWDLNTQQNASVTLAGNRTMDAPINHIAGAKHILVVIQDATGSRTLAWNAEYKFPAGIAPVLTTTAAAVDIFEFYDDGTNLLCINGSFDVK